MSCPEALKLVEIRHTRGPGVIHTLPELAIRSPPSAADNNTPDMKKKARISASPETKTLNQTTHAADLGNTGAELTVPSSEVIEIDSDADSDKTGAEVEPSGASVSEKSAALDNLAASFNDELDDPIQSFANSDCVDTPQNPEELDMATKLEETQQKLTQLHVHRSTFIKPVVGTCTDTGGEA